ncbi:YiiD C-terminal domain-containing protein [Stenomitos frigidus]|uniref:Thioesterase putative domain-containing protein n=1 Tax=Stenomitos frigidus ULC18 TaxID=2107698 RepID=A0A2T1E394_9CYAN|nr:hypothetical protein C7B82_17200 [Stenomitos frigidus ULC18]
MRVAPNVITQYAHEHIPITKHMGMTVLAIDDVQISVLAPYAPNINHRETIFGGSLSSLESWRVGRSCGQSFRMRVLSFE